MARFYLEPILASIEGEEEAELLGMEYGDYVDLRNGRNVEYLNRKYPEYMGIIPLIASLASGVAQGVTAIKGMIGPTAEESKSNLSRTIESLKKDVYAKASAKAAAEGKTLPPLESIPVTVQGKTTGTVQPTTIQRSGMDQGKLLMLVGIPLALAMMLLKRG